MRCPLLSIGLFVALSSFTFAQTETDNTESEDKTGHVFPGIADLVALRDAVNHKPHVMVMLGEQRLLPNDEREATIRPIVSIRCIDSGFEYRASFQFSAPDNIHAPLVRERLIDDGQYWLRESYGVTKRLYIKKPSEMPVDDFFVGWFAKADPFEDMIREVRSFTVAVDIPNSIEQLFFKEATFISSETITAGDVRSHWERRYEPQKNGDNLSNDLTLIQSKKNGYLPHEVKFKGKHGFYKDMFSDHRIEWKKVEEMNLPYRIEGTHRDHERTKFGITQIHMKFLWSFDKSLVSKVAEMGQDFHAQPVAQHFSLPLPDWKSGYSPEWKAPDDLYMK